VKRYRPYAPEQSFLLPPSPTEWLPESHLAYFVLELLEDIDLSEIESALQAKDARGERPYAPRMMTALWLYGYAVGVTSSRKIAKATHEDVACRVLAGGEHPHFTSVNEFRARHRQAQGDESRPDGEGGRAADQGDRGIPRPGRRDGRRGRS
jgi:transposase